MTTLLKILELLVLLSVKSLVQYLTQKMIFYNMEKWLLNLLKTLKLYSKSGILIFQATLLQKQSQSKGT